MPGDEIPDEVKKFIHRTIESVDQLEVLLFLMSNPDREWSAEEVSAKIRLASESTAEKLRDLTAAHLLTARDRPPMLYRYAPSSRAIEGEVAENLNRAYREGRDAIIQLIYTRPLDNIRIFADSFRIKRKED